MGHKRVSSVPIWTADEWEDMQSECVRQFAYPATTDCMWEDTRGEKKEKAATTSVEYKAHIKARDSKIAKERAAQWHAQQEAHRVAKERAIAAANVGPKEWSPHEYTAALAHAAAAQQWLPIRFTHTAADRDTPRRFIASIGAANRVFILPDGSEHRWVEIRPEGNPAYDEDAKDTIETLLKLLHANPVSQV